MSRLNQLSIYEAKEKLSRGEVSSEELTKDCLKAIENGKAYNAFITVTPEIALSSARDSDTRRAEGKKIGALEGIPLGFKDLFCSRKTLTSAGSKILENFVPTYESKVTENLLGAGAVMLGKTNLDEFAMGSANLTSHFGPVKNPWVSSEGAVTVPGGSSGGSAACVAADLVIGAIGTDTGGSIRQPASFCGIVGMKPTYGRCSRWGTIAFASSLDQAGPMTKCVRDAAEMLSVMAGFDSRDSTSAPFEVPEFSNALTNDVRGLKIGIPREYRLPEVPIEIEKLWQQGADMLRDLGAEILEISLPHTKYALPAYYIIAPAEASSNLARYDGVRYGIRVQGQSLDQMYANTRGEGFGAEVRRRILIGTYVLSAGYYEAYYLKAQKVRRRIADDFSSAFKKVDIVLTPTSPSSAFPINKSIVDPIKMYLNDVFTVPSSMAGLPAISIPAGLNDQGLPLGLQLIGRAFDEETVFRVAQALEKQVSFSEKPNGLKG